MSDNETRVVVRRLCYAALPVSAVLIVPAFSLMPNRKYGGSIFEAEAAFQAGFVMALAGVGIAAVAMLILVLGAEE